MTPFVPQQAVDTDIAQLPDYCTDDRWAGMQKANGHRRLVLVDDGSILPINRKGEPTSLPPVIASSFRLAGRWGFDGELMGDDTFQIFDMPVCLDRINEKTTFTERRRFLEGIFPSLGDNPAVQLLPVAWNTLEKARLFRRLVEERGEGMMLYDVDGVYTPCRKNPLVRRAKFRKTIDCVVTELRRGGKDNMVVAVYDHGHLVEIGEVTALAGDGPRIKVDDVVEVVYLDSSTDRKLFQPTLPRLRPDKSPEECTVDQLVLVNKAIIDWRAH